MTRFTVFTFILCVCVSTITCQVLERYTPIQADWSGQNSKPLDSNTAHDPDGVTAMTQEMWEATKWDGTLYDPTKLSEDDFYDAICPQGIVRGLREEFYKYKPFADNMNPTKAEVDEWHRIVINQIRALVGFNKPEELMNKDFCMFARAQWGAERKFTTQWDTEYPDDTCQGVSNAHCAWRFFPSAEDQEPYLPANHSTCGPVGESEGVFPVRTTEPWSLKLNTAFCSTLKQEGYWGGHVGPFMRRTKFGLSFWDNNATESKSWTTIRGKWTGTVTPVRFIKNDGAADASNRICINFTLLFFVVLFLALGHM